MRDKADAFIVGMLIGGVAVLFMAIWFRAHGW
jgi:hypothetical protein